MNRNFAKITENGASLAFAPNAVRVDGRYVVSPSAATYAAAGYYPVTEAAPAEAAPAGKHYEPRGWEYAPSAAAPEAIRRVYRLVDDPPPPPRTFSKLKLYAAISAAGLWDALEAWLKAQTFEGVNAYAAFMLARDIEDDHPMFQQWFAAVKQALDVSDEAAEAILAASVA